MDNEAQTNSRAAILVVDDEPRVVRSVARIFASGPVRVLTATDPHKALHEVASQPDLRLVISDYLMPGMNGLEFLSEVQRFNDSLIRIILTGHADLGAVLQAINQVGVYKFILKPWNNHDLYWTVLRALELDEVRREKQRLQQQLASQSRIMKRIEQLYPGISRIERDADGAIVLDEEI
jgi:DNA-binding NtrC family response regulator